jgi:hypothetical protein
MFGEQQGTPVGAECVPLVNDSTNHRRGHTAQQADGLCREVHFPEEVAVSRIVEQIFE